MNERARDVLEQALDYVKHGYDPVRAGRLAAQAVRLIGLKWRRVPGWFREGEIVEWSGGRPAVVVWAEHGRGVCRGAQEGEQFEVVFVSGCAYRQAQVIDLQLVGSPESPTRRTEYDGYGKFPWRRTGKK